MHFFQYHDEALYAEKVSIESIVSKVGTPVYIYSYNTLVKHIKV